MNRELRNDWSFLLRVSVAEGGFERLDLVPVKLHYARVDLATGGERETVLNRMDLLSAEMGTVFARREALVGQVGIVTVGRYEGFSYGPLLGGGQEEGAYPTPLGSTTSATLKP